MASSVCTITKRLEDATAVFITVTCIELQTTTSIRNLREMESTA